MIVFDLDGTLSIVGDRLKYLELKDWDSFYNACGEDKVNKPVAAIFRIMTNAGENVSIVTGRRESCRIDTLKKMALNFKGMREVGVLTI